ncbi:DUF2846 domain-containing protein [Pseudomonas zeae]|uniref:DUF2846 domain-containing protein n=1 Tax=Pseudomonas zeae TaxID=2745510 RepID=A0A9E6NP51_9PSED|nr:DUF2846 domain-containing protein [Pseudomonas zeae]QXI11252.1 DUF2846 domain-containing protein [Pseudomonas zeae]
MQLIKRATLLPLVLSFFFAPIALGLNEAPSKTSDLLFQSYQPSSAAAKTQAKVIYYREKNGKEKEPAANVYVDGHFHTTLMPGSYTVFCISPGQHVLGAYEHDAPLYVGKSKESHHMLLEAGKTYFVKNPVDASGVPVEIKRAEAELSLKKLNKQQRFVSRAPIQSCITQ